MVPAKGPDTASRAAAQRGKMRARNIAMPKNREPRTYSIDAREYTVVRPPRFVGTPVPPDNRNALSTNVGAMVVNSGRIVGSMNEMHI
jgi:hypothetical protein